MLGTFFPTLGVHYGMLLYLLKSEHEKHMCVAVETVDNNDNIAMPTPFSSERVLR
jgi:hypothetical protein